ncbi:uncharacterized protein LOC131020784 isoform X2 [Salvia miltiorrhiza]|uniref:uncharacterized protein LOC131020784 isoform X2 n=1 Tax=Salvia miltiorrhiza TaxID=226208 RepID=UPI0025AD4E20|nr:uncharacterized protein LOC131020784 isoform X2 [Salvia miltiorrhiza]
MAEREVDEECDEERAKSDEDLETNSESILAAINIALILSSLSPSDRDEQRLNLEERESGIRGKNSGSRSDFPARSQQVSGFSRALERQQTSKVQAKIRDCRHSRRL